MLSGGLGYAAALSFSDHTMRRANRLFRIVLLLSRRLAVTARELAEALEISERTIYRDIAVDNDFHSPRAFTFTPSAILSSG